MKIKKTLFPGQPGTKRLTKKYGQKLICVRYRYIEHLNKRIKSVELIEDENDINKKINNIPANKKMRLKVGYDEKYIQKLIKQAGGRWNSKDRVWELNFKDVDELGLKNRIVN